MTDLRLSAVRLAARDLLHSLFPDWAVDRLTEDQVVEAVDLYVRLSNLVYDEGAGR